MRIEIRKVVIISKQSRLLNLSRFRTCTHLHLKLIQEQNNNRFTVKCALSLNSAKFRWSPTCSSTSSCTVDRTGCNSSPCLNGGSCSVVPKFNDTGHYIPAIECQCVRGYVGENCESEYKTALMKHNVT